jgi:hypothetical protein
MDANATAFTTTQTQQRLQRALACAFQQSLETVNITDIAATTEIIPVSPLKLTSNGSRQCVRQTQRILGASTSGSSDVNVVFALENPTSNMTGLTTYTTHGDVLAFASSVGSSSVQGYQDAGQNPTTKPNTRSVIFGSVFGGFLAIAIVVAAIYSYNKRRKFTSPSPAVKVISSRLSPPKERVTYNPTIF